MKIYLAARYSRERPPLMGDRPAIGDAIVVNGIKYRLAAIDKGYGITLLLKKHPQKKPRWRLAQAEHTFTWDPRVGAWRTAPDVDPEAYDGHLEVACECPDCRCVVEVERKPCGHLICSACIAHEGQMDPDFCHVCTPPAPFEREEALVWLTESYFDAWEIRRAKESSNPVATLRSFATTSCRVSGGPHLPWLDTHSGKIAVWAPSASKLAGDPPLVELSCDKLARLVLNKLTKSDLLPRTEDARLAQIAQRALPGFDAVEAIAP